MSGLRETRKRSTRQAILAAATASGRARDLDARYLVALSGWHTGDLTSEEEVENSRLTVPLQQRTCHEVSPVYRELSPCPAHPGRL